MKTKAKKNQEKESMCVYSSSGNEWIIQQVDLNPLSRCLPSQFIAKYILWKKTEGEFEEKKEEEKLIWLRLGLAWLGLWVGSSFVIFANL